MDFGETVKRIRSEKGLTQEQFAKELNVTRQAVSNWENDKNLPDIAMLILMSDVFQVSLDELIKGESSMSNMTEKVIRDGSEGKRARYNMVTSIIGGALILLGVLLFVIKGMSVEYIDADGFLHENFFLIPAGYLCIFSGVIAFLVAGVRSLVARVRARRKKQ